MFAARLAPCGIWNSFWKRYWKRFQFLIILCYSLLDIFSSVIFFLTSILEKCKISPVFFVHLHYSIPNDIHSILVNLYPHVLKPVLWHFDILWHTPDVYRFFTCKILTASLLYLVYIYRKNSPLFPVNDSGQVDTEREAFP